MFDSCSFEGVRVALGDAPYHRCTFTRCTMVCDGRPFDLQECKFDGCNWTFEGPAGNGIALLKMLCNSDPAFAMNVATDFGLTSGPVTKH